MMPPIVHGWPFGSPQFAKPVATNSCGVHAASKMPCDAATFGVPTWNTDASTWSFSTSSVASGGVLFGSYASSLATSVTLWPSMPPASFTFANTAFMPCGIAPNAARAPVSGTVIPSTMSAPSARGVLTSAGQPSVGTLKVSPLADPAAVVAAAAAVVAAAAPVVAAAAPVVAVLDPLSSPHATATNVSARPTAAARTSVAFLMWVLPPGADGLLLQARAPQEWVRPREMWGRRAAWAD